MPYLPSTVPAGRLCACQMPTPDAAPSARRATPSSTSRRRKWTRYSRSSKKRPAPVAAKPYGKPVVDDDSDDGTTYGLASEGRNKDDDDSGSKGSTPRGKPRLPNFRKGKDNRT